MNEIIMTKKLNPYFIPMVQTKEKNGSRVLSKIVLSVALLVAVLTGAIVCG